MKLMFTTMLIFVSIFLFAQKKNLKIDDRAVSNLLLWFDKPNEINTEDLSRLPANLIMEAIYMDYHGNSPTFKNCLQSFLSNDTLSIHYELKKAYKNRVQIKNLFELIQKADLNQSLQNLTPYFSKSDLENVNCQVYYVLTGWKWGDAMKLNCKIENGKAKGDEKAPPTLLFNLRIATDLYGKTAEQQLSTFKNVFTHELFHAIYGEYFEKKWPNTKNNTTSNCLKYTLLNEGIAHYLGSSKESQNKNKDKATKLFNIFHDKFSEENLSKLSDEDKRTLISKGTYGEFYSKYVAVTGMFMIKYIADMQGEKGIKDCIEKGYDYFIETYNKLAKRNGSKNLMKIPSNL